MLLKALAAEIGFLYLFAGGELPARAGEGYLAGLHNVGSVGDGERHLRVLLDEEYRRAALVELLDDVEYLLD